MSSKIGIRKEDKNQWEKRVPLTPDHLKELKEKYDIDPIVQNSPIRAFTDQEYLKEGITVKENLDECPIIFAVKEIPSNLFEENKTYVFFSHVIKGQKYNMSMLRTMMEKKCNLIDYEKISDKNNRRLVFFGRFAGIAGMLDSLWAFGQRMKWKGINTPLSEIKQTIHYTSLDEIKKHLKEIGKKIQNEGLNQNIAPMVIGIAGYGNVSKGTQEVLACLPVKEIRPNQLEAVHQNYSENVIYKVVFKEEDIVEPVSSEEIFNLEHYYKNPHLYRSLFHNYVPDLSILMNCIYWDKRYPRLVTKEFLEEIFTGQINLQVVGDISVDVNGAIEFTEKVTNPAEPTFVYNPIRDDIMEGYKGEGVVVMAVDNLPCELPIESSKEFSKILMPFVPNIAKADYTLTFDKLELPDEIKKAVILYHGELTPDYKYINNYL